MAQPVNKTELAELQGVSLPTITKWMAEGMPIATKGGRGVGYEFENVAVTEWRVARAQKKALGGAADETEAAAKRRKMQAEADIAEMKAAQIRGELCVMSDLVEDIQNDLAKVRARLLAIPTRAAPLVVGLEEHEARKFIQDLIYESLDELSVIDMDQFFEPFISDVQKQAVTKQSSETSLLSGRFSVKLNYDGERQHDLAPSTLNFS